MEFDSFEEVLNFIEDYANRRKSSASNKKVVEPQTEKKSVKIEDDDKFTDLDKQYSITTTNLPNGDKFHKICILAPYLNMKSLEASFKKNNDQYSLNVKWENSKDPAKNTVYCSFRISKDGYLVISGFKKIDKKSCTIDYINGIIEISFREMTSKTEDQFTFKLK